MTPTHRTTRDLILSSQRRVPAGTPVRVRSLDEREDIAVVEDDYAMFTVRFADLEPIPPAAKQEPAP